MIRRIIAIVLCSLVLISAYSQKRNKKYDKAIKTFEAGEYKEAVNLLKDAYNMVNDKEIKTEIVFLISECFRLSNDPTKAEMWYKKAISREYPNPLIYFYYAQMMKMNGEYEDAIVQFQHYQSLVPEDERTEKEITACEKAMQWMEKPNGYIVENMKFFNSKESDFAPMYANAEFSEVYFTSSREGATGNEIHGATNENFTDIFYTIVDRKGSWSEPVPLGEAINSEFEDGVPSLTTDYKTMYFTRCKVGKNKNFGCGIYTSQRDGTEWGKAENLELGSDSIVYAHPAISPDGNTLYFVSDMDGTLGGMDIWKVSKLADGWSEPENLGPEINTWGKEAYPFVHSDGTLYFSSNGHIGMGGLDIFKAKDNGNGTWDVENMRYPINSPYDDFGIVFESENERGYLSSSRDSRGDDEIYMFMLPPLRFNIEGVVKDEKTEEPLPEAIVKSVSSDGTTLEARALSDGTFKFMLKPSTDYLFLASAEGYLNGKERETTKGLNQSKDFKVTIYLASIEKPIELPNIFYDFASWTLRPESMVSLDKLVETLNDNPNVTIELMAHTDSRGGEKSNQELSQKRAQSVVDYLISKGIAKDRLTAKGYGESQPKVLDKKTASQSRFFEEGVTLSVDFIENLESPEEQEMAHQINRRTEFKVLRTDYVPKKKK